MLLVGVLSVAVRIGALVLHAGVAALDAFRTRPGLG